MAELTVSALTLSSLLFLAGVGVALTFLVLQSARRDWRVLSRSGARAKGPLPPLTEDTELDSALLAFAQEWGSTFDTPGDRAKLEGAFGRLHVEFFAGDTFDGKRGLTVSAQSVKVAARAWGLGRTALFHELVHWALWNLTGEPDPDHQGDRYPGWGPEHDVLIGKLKARFRKVEEGAEPEVSEKTAKGSCGTCERAL